MKKIFITGGAGFIGSHICEEIFHTFKKNNWKNLLDPKIEKKIRKAFSKEMKELGYI